MASSPDEHHNACVDLPVECFIAYGKTNQPYYIQRNISFLFFLITLILPLLLPFVLEGECMFWCRNLEIKWK